MANTGVLRCRGKVPCSQLWTFGEDVQWEVRWRGKLLGANDWPRAPGFVRLGPEKTKLSFPGRYARLNGARLVDINSGAFFFREFPQDSVPFYASTSLPLQVEIGHLETFASCPALWLAEYVSDPGDSRVCGPGTPRHHHFTPSNSGTTHF